MSPQHPTNGSYVPAKVRAKFWVVSQNRSVGSATVTLSAVCRGEDNKEWAAATPSGQITMTINNGAAAPFFEPGDEVFVDFTKIEKDRRGAPGMGD